ncbi:MAG: hypothetical protein ACRCX5_14515 [Bacteroidales bacterium]
MQGYEVSFKIYAESQEDADQVSKAFKDFVENQRVNGRAVTAQKLMSALNKLENNAFVKSQVNNFFK